MVPIVADGAVGPARLPAADTWQFLSAGPAGALCVDTGGDGLRAVPAKVTELRSDEVALHTAGDAAELQGPGCFVADEFAAYEEIHGVIVQGVLTATGERSVRLAVIRATGFSFGGRVRGG